MALGIDGRPQSREFRESREQRRSLVSNEPLTFSLPASSNNSPATPAEALLAKDTAGPQLQAHRANIVIRAGCFTLLNALHTSAFFTSKDGSRFAGYPYRFDGSAFLKEPSVLAGQLGALNFSLVDDLASRTTSLLLSSVRLQQEMGLDAPLHPFLQGIDSGIEAIDWQKEVSLAATELKTRLHGYTLKPNSNCDGLELFQKYDDRGQWKSWSPADSLRAYREDLARSLNGPTYSSELTNLYRDKAQQAAVYTAVPTSQFLNLFLSPQAIFALAYGGYYRVSTGNDRVQGLPVIFAGEDSDVYAHQWENLVNNLHAANQGVDERILHKIGLSVAD